MGGSQGVLLLMMGSLILYLVWHPASPFNDASLPTSSAKTPDNKSGGNSAAIQP